MAAKLCKTNKYLNQILIFLFLQIFLIGCNASQKLTVIATRTPPGNQLNIEVSNIDISQNQYLIGFVITNLSTDRIWFPVGMNGVYSYYDPVNEKWVPVKDTMKVISLRPQIILEPQGDIINDNFSFSIVPAIPNEFILTNNEILLRIEISGFKMNGEEKTSIPVKTKAEFVKKPSHE